ncbi:MAG TPA: MATE family efflux transporter [Treponema sp.]|nr:MATE family efflux transporter [Treponema sp.]
MGIKIFSHKVPRNASSAAKDMTVGDPAKLILLYSAPLLIGNLFQQMYNMVDTIIVGRLLGQNALAAVGNTGPMNFLVLGFAYGLSSGFAVITAQRFGAKDWAGLKRSTAMNIKLNVASSVVLTVLACVLAMPILRVINTPEEIINQSYSYIIVIFIGIATCTMYNCGACILRAVGDSKSPLVFLIISSLLNIVLDIVLIIKTDMGVAGAAWATVISQAVSAILSFVWIYAKYPMLHVHRSDFTPDVWFAKQHISIGANMAFQFSITAIGVIILQGALNKFGPAKIAAFTAAQKVEQLVTIAAGTFGVTMANYGGQNMGAKRLDRVREGTNKAVVITILFSILSAVFAVALSDQLTGLFLKDASEEVLSAARMYLRITAVFYPILFVLFIYRNVLQGIGRGFWPLMGGVLELVARTAAAYTLPLVWGFAGVCVAEPMAWCAATFPLAAAYYIIIKKIR